MNVKLEKKDESLEEGGRQHKVAKPFWGTSGPKQFADGADKQTRVHYIDRRRVSA